MDGDELIAHYVPGLSFVDIGALWGTVNERVSVAARAGAASVAVADAFPLENPIWQAFRNRMRDLGVKNVAEHQINLDDPHVHELLPPKDFVYCSGIVYHCPSPVYTLERLRTLTKRYLLVGSMVVPEVVSNSKGSIDFSGGSTVFIPGLDGTKRAIMAEHFDASGIQIMHINAETSEPFRWGLSTNYGPWWWLFSPSTLRALIENAGFRVLDSGPGWDGRAYGFFCEPV